MSTDVILSSVADVFSSDELLSIHPEDLSDGDALLVWSLFDAMEKGVISKRKAVFREHLFKIAEQHGKMNAKGSSVYSPPGSDGKVTKQCRQGKPVVDRALAQELIEGKPHGDSLITGTFTATKEKFDVLRRLVEDCAEDTQDRLLSGLADALRSVEFSISDVGLELAVTTGTITPKELQSVTSVTAPTYALLVKKPTAVQQLLERGKK